MYIYQAFRQFTLSRIYSKWEDSSSEIQSTVIAICIFCAIDSQLRQYFRPLEHQLMIGGHFEAHQSQIGLYYRVWLVEWLEAWNTTSFIWCYFQQCIFQEYSVTFHVELSREYYVTFYVELSLCNPFVLILYVSIIDNYDSYSICIYIMFKFILAEIHIYDRFNIFSIYILTIKEMFGISYFPYRKCTVFLWEFTFTLTLLSLAKNLEGNL